MSQPIQLPCPACGAVNRVDPDRVDQARCGKCRAEIFPVRPLHLTDTDFDRQILESGVPVLVDFWAPWCGPCRAMAPQFEAASARLRPWVRTAKVDTQAEPGLGARFGIQSIPTLALFINGREIARQPGAMNAADIEHWTRSALGAEP